MRLVLSFLTLLFVLTDISLAERVLPRVMLDPGHGGKDLGAKGLEGLNEKDLALEVALELQELLQSGGDVKVNVTRSVDVFLSLEQRTELANEYKSDLFISLHANASPSHTLSGFEVYYLDNTGDAQSRRLAERENAVAQTKHKDDLTFMLSDMVQIGKMGDSITLARYIDGALSNRLVGKWEGAKSLGVRKAPFFVLMGAKMPCVLVELFFIDHKRDVKLLQQPQFRKDLVAALAQGILDYLAARRILLDAKTN